MFVTVAVKAGATFITTVITFSIQFFITICMKVPSKLPSQLEIAITAQRSSHMKVFITFHPHFITFSSKFVAFDTNSIRFGSTCIEVNKVDCISCEFHHISAAFASTFVLIPSHFHATLINAHQLSPALINMDANCHANAMIM